MSENSDDALFDPGPFTVSRPPVWAAVTSMRTDSGPRVKSQATCGASGANTIDRAYRNRSVLSVVMRKKMALGTEKRDSYVFPHVDLIRIPAYPLSSSEPW